MYLQNHTSHRTKISPCNSGSRLKNKLLTLKWKKINKQELAFKSEPECNKILHLPSSIDITLAMLGASMNPFQKCDQLAAASLAIGVHHYLGTTYDYEHVFDASAVSAFVEDLDTIIHFVSKKRRPLLLCWKWPIWPTVATGAPIRQHDDGNSAFSEQEAIKTLSTRLILWCSCKVTWTN